MDIEGQSRLNAQSSIKAAEIKLAESIRTVAELRFSRRGHFAERFWLCHRVGTSDRSHDRFFATDWPNEGTVKPDLRKSLSVAVWPDQHQCRAETEHRRDGGRFCASSNRLWGLDHCMKAKSRPFGVSTSRPV